MENGWLIGNCRGIVRILIWDIDLGYSPNWCHQTWLGKCPIFRHAGFSFPGKIMEAVDFPAIKVIQVSPDGNTTKLRAWEPEHFRLSSLVASWEKPRTPKVKAPAWLGDGTISLNTSLRQQSMHRFRRHLQILLSSINPRYIMVCIIYIYIKYIIRIYIYIWYRPTALTVNEVGHHFLHVGLASFEVPKR